MKIRFNWGTGIVLVIIIIIIGLGVLVWIAARQDFDLVDKDYYQNGVQYQQHIDKIKNTNSLSDKITYSTEGTNLVLKFPFFFRNHPPEGQIFFYSPVNESNDYKIPVHLSDSLSQVIDLNLLKSGRYIIKIDWSSDSLGYYQEINLTVE